MRDVGRAQQDGDIPLKGISSGSIRVAFQKPTAFRRPA